MVAAGYAVPACRGAALACPARRASRVAPRVRRAAPVGATSGDASDSSDRVSTLQNEGAYAVLAKATALEREGRDIVHLEIGQPGFPTPEHIVEAGVDAIRGGKTKYAAPDGAPSLREAVAAHVSETRGVAVSPDEVVVGRARNRACFSPRSRSSTRETRWCTPTRGSRRTAP